MRPPGHRIALGVATTTLKSWNSTQAPSTHIAESRSGMRFRKQDEDFHARVQHEIGADDAGDRARGADQRRRRKSVP